MPKNGVIYCSKSCADHHNVKFAAQVGQKSYFKKTVNLERDLYEFFSIFKKLKNLSVNMLDILWTLSRIKMMKTKNEFHFLGKDIILWM